LTSLVELNFDELGKAGMLPETVANISPGINAIPVLVVFEFEL
jgi:hypothetical protein